MGMNENKMKNVIKSILQILSILFVVILVFVMLGLYQLHNSLQGLSRPTPQTNGIVTIHEKYRYQNSKEGNSRIHSEYPSVEEFDVSGEQVRFLGKKDNHLLFEVFISNLAKNKRNYAMFNQNHIAINQMTHGDGVCSGAQKIDEQTFMIKGGEPTIICMPLLSNEDMEKFIYFGNLAIASKSGRDVMESIKGITIEPKQTKYLKQNNTLFASEAGVETDVTYFYDKVEKKDVVENNENVTYTLVYMEVNVPKMYSGYLPSKMPTSKMCHKINGTIACAGEVEWPQVKLFNNSYSITSQTLAENPQFLESKKGHSLTYIRLYKDVSNSDYIVDDVEGLSVLYLER